MQIMCGSTDLTNRLLSYKRKIFFPEHRLIGNAPTAKLEIELLNEDSAITEALLQNTFTVTEGSVVTGVFSVMEKPQKYTKKLSLELYDNMCKTDIPYKSELDYSREETPVTILSQLTEMSVLAGVVIYTADLPVAILTKVVGWIDTTYSIRTYLSWIAELAGMNVMCDNTGTIRFYDLSTTADYTTSDLADYSTEELWTLGRVRFDDGLSVYEYPEEYSNNTLYISNKNLYFDSNDYAEAIYTKYSGLSVMITDNIRMPGIDNLRLGQIINYNNLFSFFALDLASTFTGGSYCDFDISGLLETKETESTVVRYDDSVRIKKVQTIVDQLNGELSIIAQDVHDNNTFISQFTVSPEQITSTVENAVVQDDLSIYTTKTELKQESDKISGELTQTIQGVDGKVETIKGGVDVTMSGDQTIVTIGNSTSDVRGQFTNTGVNFIDKQNQKLAWLDTEGLGSKELSVGDATTKTNRWRIFTRENGSHLTFTRHN